MFWACAAVSAGQFISPGGDGSGLPQIKSILAGTPVRGHFSWRVFVAKLYGLQCALVGGMSVGKEVRAHLAKLSLIESVACVCACCMWCVRARVCACCMWCVHVCVIVRACVCAPAYALSFRQIPFSHIAGIIAHKLWRLNIFSTIRGSHALRRQVLAAGTLLSHCVWNGACVFMFLGFAGQRVYV